MPVDLDTYGIMQQTQGHFHSELPTVYLTLIDLLLLAECVRQP